ncbi:MAG TPA: hypothetical protein DEP48_08820 [Persephonella sp.]|uniref:Uncharacterized protein n=1 Tax=Persephonella marina (strain DSM 14350 / EX-H1) TaxID=123214 RepID=C0QTC1_PERMH|nr:MULTISPECIES: hypothetical protein [Persephonella]ACO03947.1 hypothetical protein PERMA_0139 [Persephonella marina EX-H1]HCB70445.1 hypothetical protein [Persephonella sp.]
MGKIKNPKIFYKNLFLFGIFFVAIFLMIRGYLLLYTDDLDVAQKVIKIGKAEIETVTGKKFETQIKGLKKNDDEIYIISDEGQIPLKDILYIDGKNINQKIIKNLSDRAIKGIFYVVSGGFIFLFLILIRNYI